MVTYTTSQKVADLLQQNADFDERAASGAEVPYKEQVEAIITRVETKIDRITRRSWKTNTATNEEHEFHMSGVKVKHQPLISITSAEIYQGNTYRSLTEGRNQEFFIVKELGMFYFTRFFVPAFVLPIAEGPASPIVFEYAWRYPLRLTYTWGYDFSSHEDAPFVEDVATKLTILDLLQMHERSVITKAGVNRQDMQGKIKEWKTDVESDLAALSTGFTVW